MADPAWTAHLQDDHDLASFDPGRGGTLPHLWNQTWLNNPEKRVIWDDGAWTTAEELRRRTTEVAARLHGRGLMSGDRVIISAKSSVDLVAVHAACLGLGAIVIPTNSAYGAEELAHVVGDSRPRFAITDSDETAAHVSNADASIVVAGVTAEFEPDSVDWPGVSPSDSAMIGYTSGTTGRPKGAVLTHANLLASVNALMVAWRWTSSDRLVLCLPLFHMHGLGVGLHGTLAAGGSAVLQPHFDPEAVFDAIEEFKPTLFFGVPTMYHRLADSKRAKQLSRLRLMVSGSAPMPPDLHGRLSRLTGNSVLERYGMTETVMLVSNPHDLERKGGTVGIPLPGVDLRLDKATSEVQVRGPNVFGGYWNNQSATAEAFDNGWFRTGDVGAIGDDGYLSLVGRLKELIISGGMNIYPREVEDAIRTHANVEDVAVIGAPSAEWGEQVVAFVTGGPVSIEDVRSHIGGSLAPYKHPRAVHVVESLPRNALGKVQKHRLVPHG